MLLGYTSNYSYYDFLFFFFWLKIQTNLTIIYRVMSNKCFVSSYQRLNDKVQLISLCWIWKHKRIKMCGRYSDKFFV